ncbi:GNAT family N-acetyltransferase [Nodosilinea sp. LEGE 07298]|uniref:GNAT family N-acetyltransferase n=1 Tax=Nodosilinea sp. LEGE 07298 TaxID=2777970 RepID=UPI0018813F13|nr:GNAT family N-acetyltransferase [Nodosilinea sp. LEGE 07298]MBE9109852.1 GNAT family N-acetyltransferase [Nodosilinea sp. LEGE 07298]
MTTPPFTTRLNTPADLPVIEAMLFEAFFWSPTYERPALEEFRQQPEFQKLVANWGRPGDRAVIAEVPRQAVGAAWYRFWTESCHSYGFVNAATPEVGIGVHPDYRGRGMGRALLRHLLSEARRSGVPALSLSVDPQNVARQLYESEGFVKVGESGTSWTLTRIEDRASV